VDLEVSPEMDKRRAMFLKLLFDKGKGYFCIAYGPRDRDPKKFREHYFKFPEDVDEAVALVNEVYHGNNVWFCPHLFNKPKRVKENVVFTPCAWSDLDTCQPDELFVKPTFLIESSDNRWQGLWMFNSEVDPDDAEEISHRIAYTHADQGADRTGWDLTQLLRFPYTYNYKYATTPVVTIADANKNKYSLEDFEADYDKVQGYMYLEDVELPDISMINGEELLTNKRLQLPPTIWRLYQEPLAKDASWSEPLWKLMMMLFEADFSREQVFAIVQDAACNKYERDGMPQRLLWKDVCRAESKYNLQLTPILLGDDGYQEKPLVSDEERQAVLREDTFIERYIEWAKSLGDAAPQYHQAGAFTALSCLLAGSVQLPTSFGVMKPNLWFMILADTTLTRKSTAMDIAMDLVTEIDPDVVMATDGSLEGMLTSLSTRPSRPSVFLRDEFSGLLEAMTKKDYMAGMPELLTKLYDGKMQKRLLRKETIDIRDPCFILFAGGIKDKITSLLSFEHVSSGFMPRFVFITAESDLTRVKPLGPPTEMILGNKAAIQEELERLYNFYNQEDSYTVAGSDIRVEGKRKFDATLTQEAWYRYNLMESQMLDAGMHAERPAIMTPVYDRLSKSILKGAVLLAASRKLEPTVVVEEIDIVRAMVYGESWRVFARDVMNSVGKGTSERLLDNVFALIEREPGVSRSKIMQAYHLEARQASQIFDTLEQRGKIVRSTKGKGMTFHPSVIYIQKEKV
jgi:hypothetical protein